MSIAENDLIVCRRCPLSTSPNPSCQQGLCPANSWWFPAGIWPEAAL